MENVKIIGSGIIGLSTGVCLNSLGYNTEIIAEDIPMETGDYKDKQGIATEYATASVKPSTIPNKNLENMLKDSIDIFDKIEEDTNKVEIVPHFMGGEKYEHPEFKDTLHNFKTLTESEYDFPFETSKGGVFDVHYLHMQDYIPYLIGLYEETGGTIRKSSINNLENINSDYIFNCTGYGSKDLTKDQNLKPVRGHLVYVETGEKLSSPKYDGPFSYSYTFDNKKVYCYPNKDMIILGKTAIHNSKDWETYNLEEEYYDLDKGEKVPKHVIDKNAKILKNSIDLDIHDYKMFGTSGYRPYREKGIRVEKENNIIHNYGHGGSGATFSWGSALKSVRKITDENIKNKVIKEINNYKPLF